MTSLAETRAEVSAMQEHLSLLAQHDRLRAELAAVGVSPLAPRLTLRSLAQLVANERGIRLDELLGPGKYRAFVLPRQEFMWRARQVKCANGTHRYSFSALGRFLKRDHTTVSWGVSAHEKRMAEGRG